MIVDGRKEGFAMPLLTLLLLRIFDDRQDNPQTSNVEGGEIVPPKIDWSNPSVGKSQCYMKTHSRRRTQI